MCVLVYMYVYNIASDQVQRIQEELGKTEGVSIAMKFAINSLQSHDNEKDTQSAHIALNEKIHFSERKDGTIFYLISLGLHSTFIK